MESDVKIIPDEKLAVINYKGPIDDLEVLISKIMGWIEAEEIEVLSEPFVVYYSPRHEVNSNNNDVVFDVGIVLKNDEDEKDIIRVVDMVEHKVLSAIHEGPTDDILDTYSKLVDVAQHNNYDIIGSPKEILIKSFHNCDSEKDFVTEIQLPIIEM